jgi:hypothetical protein
MMKVRGGRQEERGDFYLDSGTKITLKFCQKSPEFAKSDRI